MSSLAGGNDHHDCNAAPRHTTSAIDLSDNRGRSIYFDDLVTDDEIVEVDGRRMRVYYDPQAPDWFVEPTAAAANGRTRLTARDLGWMTGEQLDAAAHCRLCLEPYHLCSCREGVQRRKEAENAD